MLSGGPGAEAAAHDEAVLDFIRRTAPRCRRVATVCSGAFLGAAAGLFDGRRVTTHWARARQLAEDYPGVTVDADPIYIRDGKYWSSAGVTAGIDLSLALVQEDLGVDVAQTVARWLVMFLHRPGGQTQFASPVWVPRAERSTIRAVQSLVEAAPGGDHRLPALAAAAAMSVRHFTRVFTAEVGETPSRFVERTRLEAARRELEETTDTLDVVAARCGLGSAESLRRVFQRHLGVPPDAYRRRFRAAPRERTSRMTDTTLQIAIPLFPKFTALDAVGPYEVLQRIPNFDIVFVGHEPRRGAQRERHDRAQRRRHLRGGGDARRGRLPRRRGDAAAWSTMRGCSTGCAGPTPGPGSPRRSAPVRWCSGAAGLLQGLTATTHWSCYPELAAHGAEPTPTRVVEHLDERIITSAGVSSGIDMALRLVELLADRTAAQAAQLMIEYDPQPPFDCGSVDKADDVVMTRIIEYAALRQ